MRFFLLSGEEHQYVAKYIESKKHVVVNKTPLNLAGIENYLQDNDVSCDTVVITDGALSADFNISVNILATLSARIPNITVITRDYLFVAPNNVSIVVTNWFRAVEEDFNKAFELSKDGFRKSEDNFDKIKSSKTAKETVSKRQDETPKKKKWGSRFKKDDTERFFDSISIDRSSSRVIVFTGRRGSGVTSSAMGVALSSKLRGLKTILVDLDIDYRSLNLYSGEFNKWADDDEDISSSLVRLIAQPHKYEAFAVNDDGLWMTSLGYGFSDDKLILQHITESKLIGLFTSLKHSFDMVIVDFPLDKLSNFPAILNNADALALCMENNLYSAFSTIRNIVIGFENKSNIPYFASKSKLIVTKYNDESLYDGEPITPTRLSELIVNESFCDDFIVEMPVAGSVPYEKHFDRQIESDISIIHTDNLMKQAYDGILLHLAGAVK